MQKTNEAVRKALKENKVRLWQLADILEVSEMTVNRMLRHEMPEKRQNEIIALIESWARENNQ